MRGVDLTSDARSMRHELHCAKYEWNASTLDKRRPFVSTFALHLRHNALSYFALLVALGSADVYRRFDLDARPVD